LTYWLLVAAAVFYRTRDDAREGVLRSAKLAAQLSAARLEMLRQQLHPHFLFNTLQAVTTLVHEDADRAEEVLLRLSELLRVSLHESQQQEIRLERELDILDHYIAIQTCRFGDRLRFDVQVDRDVLACAVPSLLLQPLVENAVRHGIGVHKENDTVTIQGRRQGNLLRLAVSNVNSTLEATTDRLFGQGVGLATTRERLEQLYGTERASFRLRSLQPKGVCAEVTLPFRLLRPEVSPAIAEAVG
jgi:LytS/YehU family sensor histidine kinase